MERRALFTASTYSHIAHFHRPYLRAFAQLGWTVDVACGGEPLPIPEARRVIPLSLEKSIWAPAKLRAQRVLRQAMRTEGYDLISTHTSLAAFFTRLAAQGLDTVVVNTCHGYLFDGDTPAPKRELLLGAERLTSGRTDLLLTMNRCDEEIALRHRLGRQIRSIPGIGADFSALDAVPASAGKALRAEWGVPEDAFVLIYPAEFSKRKNQETLLRALALLPERIYLLLPGEGALRENCEDLARELGVWERVRFPGYVSQMAIWYRAADCAVTASRSEGLPFNVMEAMHCGLPVVASAVKGHEDLIREEENGLLFPFGDVEACARRIRRLGEDSSLAARLGRQGMADAEAFRLERVLPQVLEAYRAVVPELGELSIIHS